MNATGKIVSITLFLVFVCLPIYCVHIVFEQNFVFPFFILLTCPIILHPFTEIPVLID